MIGFLKKMWTKAKSAGGKFATFVGVVLVLGTATLVVTIGPDGEWILTAGGSTMTITDSLKYAWLDSSEVKSLDSLALIDTLLFQEQIKEAFYQAFPHVSKNGLDTIYGKDVGQWNDVAIRLAAGEDLFYFWCYYAKEDQDGPLGYKKGMIIDVSDPITHPNHPTQVEWDEFQPVKEHRRNKSLYVSYLVANQNDSVPSMIDTATYLKRKLTVDFAKAGITLTARGVTSTLIDTAALPESSKTIFGGL